MNNMHSVETPVACKKYGGIWDRENRICIESTGDLGGCIAPTKGVQFCWRGIDLYNDVESVPEWKDKYITEVLGFDLRNDNIIWDLAEWDSPEFLDLMEDAVSYGRDLACEIASDVLHGRADGWLFSYIGPGYMKHKRPSPLVHHSVVPDEEKMKERFKPFRIRRTHG